MTRKKEAANSAAENSTPTFCMGGDWEEFEQDIHRLAAVLGVNPGCAADLGQFDRMLFMRGLVLLATAVSPNRQEGGAS